MQAEQEAPTRFKAWHALLVIMAAGAFLRFFRLEHQSFWYDESVSARFTTYPVLDVLLGRESDLGNPPLHYALLNLWTRVFGPSDAAMRSLSAAASVAGIPLLYALAKRLAGTRIALVAAALLALSPSHVYFAQETRTYAVAIFLVTLSVYSLRRAEDSPKSLWPWVTYAATVFLCPYAHYYCFFFLAGHVVYVLLIHRADRPYLIRWAVAVAVGALLFSLIWLPTFYAQVTTKGNLSRTAEGWRLHLLATPMYFSVGTTLVWKDTASWPRLAGALVALSAFGTAFVAGLVALRKDRRTLTLLLVWLGSPILLPLAFSVLVSPIYNARYAMIASPAFLLIAGAGLVYLSRVPRIATASGIALASLASLAFYFTTTVKHDWRSAAAWLDQHTRPGDIIAFDVDTGEAPFARYSRSDAVHLRLMPPKPDDGAVPFVGTSDRLIPPHDVSPVITAAPRVWFVLSDPGDGSDGYYEGLLDKQWVAGLKERFKGIEITAYDRR